MALVIAGAVGSGTKLISLGHIRWDEMLESYRVGIRGLLKGGADLVLIETAQDILQVKCAIAAARLAMRDVGREVPVQAQVTLETTGTTLTGAASGSSWLRGNNFFTMRSIISKTTRWRKPAIKPRTIPMAVTVSTAVSLTLKRR